MQAVPTAQFCPGSYVWGSVGRCLWPYQESRFPLSPISHTNLRLASVGPEASAALLISLHSQAHILECVGSSVQANQAPASRSAQGPRTQPGLCPRQGHWPHELIPSGIIFQLA